MDIYAEVVTRLKALGYKPRSIATKKDALQYAIDRAKFAINNNINCAEIPSGLRYVWIDMAAGLFLYDLKASGRLDGYRFDTPVKTITEGDTSTTFMGDGNNVLNPEAQFDKMLEGLINPAEHQLAAYRRMRW